MTCIVRIDPSWINSHRDPVRVPPTPPRTALACSCQANRTPSPERRSCDPAPSAGLAANASRTPFSAITRQHHEETVKNDERTERSSQSTQVPGGTVTRPSCSGRSRDQLENEGIASGPCPDWRPAVSAAARTGRRRFENRDRRCVLDDDPVNDCIERMVGADGIVLGSADLLPRRHVRDEGPDSTGPGSLFPGPTAASSGARLYLLRQWPVRRSGANHAVDTILHFLLYSGMTISGAPR